MGVFEMGFERKDKIVVHAPRTHNTKYKLQNNYNKVKQY